MKKQFLLFLVRWYEISGKPLPQWLERACDEDSALGSALDEERELTAGLKQKPDWNPVEPNPFQVERIIACLEDEERPVTSRAMPWREVSIGIAACVAIALVYQRSGSEQGPAGGELVLEENRAEKSSLEREIDVLPSDVIGLADRREWKNPLDQEIEYVLGDAKGAIDFLADRFVPSTFRSSEREG